MIGKRLEEKATIVCFFVTEMGETINTIVYITARTNDENCLITQA